MPNSLWFVKTDPLSLIQHKNVRWIQLRRKSIKGTVKKNKDVNVNIGLVLLEGETTEIVLRDHLVSPLPQIRKLRPRLAQSQAVGQWHSHVFYLSMTGFVSFP